MTEMTMPLPFVFPNRKTLDVQSSSDSGGTITLIIQDGKFEAIPAEQSWFWTEEWQAGERKVDEYIEAGNVQTFDSMEEFLDTLGD